MTLARFASASLVCSFVGLAACSDTIVPADGMVMLAIESDMIPGVDFDTVRIYASNENNPDSFEQHDLVMGDNANLPTTLALRNRGNQAGRRAHVRLLVLRQASVVLIRDLRFDMPGERGAQMAHARLNWAATLDNDVGLVSIDVRPFDNYAGAVCGGGTETPNGDGQCVSSNLRNVGEGNGVEGTSLETYDPSTVFGGGETPTSSDATCFQVLACFPSGATTALGVPELDATGCHVEVPAGTPATVNVAISTLGLRAASGDGDDKLVALDSESFSLQGTTLTLPQRYCTRIFDLPEAQRAGRIRVSAACAAKTRDTWACGTGNPADKRLIASNKIAPN